MRNISMLILFIVIVDGCVQQTTSVQTESLHDLTTGEKIVYYEPINYTLQGRANISTDYILPDKLKIQDIEYPILVKNPVLNIPVKFYINKTSINYNNSVFYPELINDTIKGLRKWEIATNGTINFIEVNNSEDSNLLINFLVYTANFTTSDPEYEYILEHQLGEGGPLEYTEYRDFTLIEKSEMFVTPKNWNRCETVDITTHEFGHALGLGHDRSRNSIMYYYLGDCKQKITDDTISALKRLYMFAKPDLRFEHVILSKVNSTLIFDVDIKNIGVTASKDVYLDVYDGNFFRRVKTIRGLRPGQIGTYKFEIDSARFQDVVEIWIDVPKSQDEINKDNNVIVLKEID